MNEPLWRRRNPAVAPSYMAAAGSDVGYSARRRVPAYPSIIDPRFVVNLENDRDLSERLLEECVRQFASAETRVGDLERAALATDEKIATVAECLRLTQAFAEQRGDGDAPLSELSDLRSFVEAAVRSCLSARVGAELAERIAAAEAAAAQAEERAMASVRDALDGHSQTFAEKEAAFEGRAAAAISIVRELEEERRGEEAAAAERAAEERAEEAARREAEAARVAALEETVAAQAAALAEAREGHVRLLARMADMEAALAGRAVPRTPTAGEPPSPLPSARQLTAAAARHLVDEHSKLRRVAEALSPGGAVAESAATTSAHGGATESAGTTGGAVVSPNAPVSPLSFEEARRAALRRAEERAAMPRPLFGSFASDP